MESDKTFYIKVKDDKIDNMKFRTFGCVAAIAVSSMVTEMAMGKTVKEAKTITKKDVAESLDGLPKEKMHCSNLGADALQLAIKNYEDKKAGIKRPEPRGEIEKHKHKDGEQCFCPYCDAELSENFSFCNACQSELDEHH